MGYAMGIIDTSVALLTEQLGKATRGPENTDEAAERVKDDPQEQYDQRDQNAMIQNYPIDNAMQGFPEMGGDFDPNMEFRGLLGEAVQVSPSATVSADLSNDEQGEPDAAYYGCEGASEPFDFMPKPGMWMMNAMVVEQWPE